MLQVSAFGDSGVYAQGTATAEPVLERVLQGVDVVILAVPTNVRHTLIAPVAASLDACPLLLAWEGAGRLRQSMRALGIAQPMIVGLQRSPILCRTQRALRSVEILGVRSEVVAATIAAEDTADAQRAMKALLPFRFAFAPNYDCVTLSPGNPLIHPARLYRCDLARLRPGGRGGRFYADWDDRASATLLALHSELARLRDALRLPAEFVHTMADAPTPPSPSQTTCDIRAARSLAGIRLPLSIGAQGYGWNLQHRFFREDIGEGLAGILEIARSAGVAMPTAQAIEHWHADLRASSPLGADAVFQPALHRAAGDAAHCGLR